MQFSSFELTLICSSEPSAFLRSFVTVLLFSCPSGFEDAGFALSELIYMAQDWSCGERTYSLRVREKRQLPLTSFICCQ
jgi:hypothetical protein